MTTRTDKTGRVAAHESIFRQILVGVDGGRLSLDACRQAARLAKPEAEIEAATVSLFPPATAKALGVDDVAESLDRSATAALGAAGDVLGPHAELRRLHGLTVETLLAEAERMQATLVAIGAPAQPRLEEIVFGGVGGELLHHARCAVLLARPVADEPSFPRRILVGIDGSDEGERAYEIARELANDRNSQFRSLAALGGKRIDFEAVAKRHPRVGASVASPVPALVEAAAGADLLVVGSRGLHGVRALGSVSERVAHRAPCSVLVVR